MKYDTGNDNNKCFILMQIAFRKICNCTDLLQLYPSVCG